MKYKIFALVSAFALTISAQNNPIDKSVETTTRTISVMENGEMIEKKIMVKTITEQEVKTDPSYENTIDVPRVFPKEETTKIIYIDNDNDPFYDKASRIVYYTKDGMRFGFMIRDYGFDVMDSSNMKSLSKVKFSNNADVYLVDNKDYRGIGYFENDEFVIEYYNDKGILMIERYQKEDK